MAMTEIQHTLSKAAEEATEVAKAALKAQQFGLSEHYNGRTNAERLTQEVIDLEATLHKLATITKEFVHVQADTDRLSFKLRKIERYLHYSKQLGQVEP